MGVSQWLGGRSTKEEKNKDLYVLWSLQICLYCSMRYLVDLSSPPETNTTGRSSYKRLQILGQEKRTKRRMVSRSGINPIKITWTTSKYLVPHEQRVAFWVNSKIPKSNWYFYGLHGVFCTTSKNNLTTFLSYLFSLDITYISKSKSYLTIRYFLNYPVIAVYLEIL